MSFETIPRGMVLDGWAIVGLGPLAENHEFIAQDAVSVLKPAEIRILPIRTHWLLLERAIPVNEWRRRLAKIQEGK